MAMFLAISAIVLILVAFQYIRWFFGLVLFVIMLLLLMWSDNSDAQQSKRQTHYDSGN